MTKAVGTLLCASIAAGGAALLMWRAERQSLNGTAQDAPTVTCESGSAAACILLAQRYATGIDRQRDISRALYFYEKACDIEAGQGCVELGYLYERGIGVPERVQDALNLY